MGLRDKECLMRKENHFTVTVPSLTNSLLTIGGIVFVDLVLSGDNALVIGAAASSVPPNRRFFALMLGGVVAILTRILFTTSATFLLYFPFLQAAGGLVIMAVAIHLLFGDKDSTEEGSIEKTEEGSEVANALPRSAKRFSRSMQRLIGDRVSPERLNFLLTILTIIAADITMSLDNVLAIGALARGNVPFLAIGLVVSILLLMVSSALVAALMTRFPWLIIIASLILAGVAADLVWNGSNLLLPQNSRYIYHIALYVIAFVAVIFFIIFTRREIIKKFVQKPS
jgi:YjbE family integral membrane protein